MNRICVAALAIGLTLSLSSCTDADLEALEDALRTPTPSTTETPVDLGEHQTPTPTPQPGTKDHPIPLGEFGASDVGSMWEVSISDTVLDGTEDVVAQNFYNEPQEGWLYVTGTISAVVSEDVPETAIGQSWSPVASVMPVFVGGDGKIYDVWRADNSAPVYVGSWLDQPDIVAEIGLESSGIFAIEVPSEAVSGGQFAVQNQTSGNIVYFGPQA